MNQVVVPFVDSYFNIQIIYMSRFTKIHPLEITTGNPKSPNQKLSIDDINYMKEQRVILHSVAKKLKNAKTAAEQTNILYQADEKRKRDKADAEACQRIVEDQYVQQKLCVVQQVQLVLQVVFVEWEEKIKNAKKEQKEKVEEKVRKPKEVENLRKEHVKEEVVEQSVGELENRKSNK